MRAKNLVQFHAKLNIALIIEIGINSPNQNSKYNNLFLILIFLSLVKGFSGKIEFFLAKTTYQNHRTGNVL